MLFSVCLTVTAGIGVIKSAIASFSISLAWHQQHTRHPAAQAVQDCVRGPSSGSAS